MIRAPLPTAGELCLRRTASQLTAVRNVLTHLEKPEGVVI